MAEILLTSETFVKGVSNISDNVAGKYLLPSIREAQEIGLRGVVGDCLLAKLKEVAAYRPAPERPRSYDDNNYDYQPYIDLLDRAQYFLAYTAIALLLPKLTWKIGNFGLAKSNDENLTVAPQEEVAKQQFYYQSKADGCCRDLQRWILQNRTTFPELRACDCAAMEANLRSSASCGIWLGGPRGRRLPGGGGCC